MVFKLGNNANPNGARRAQKFRQAIEMELKSCGDDIKEIRLIIRRCIEQAKDGDFRAREWLADRLDGKIAQALVGADGEEIQVHHTIVRKIVAPELLHADDLEPVEPIEASPKPRLLTRQGKDVI